MLPSDIKELIITEQTKQSGNFVQGISVDDYFLKIENNAEVICQFNAGECIGVIAYYCNDPDKVDAFLTMLLVSPAARGKGVAKNLVNSMLTSLRSRGFKRCGLEVDKTNFVGIKLYESLGFITVDKDKRCFKMSLNLEHCISFDKI